MKKVVVAEASPTIKSVADSLLRQNGYDVVCTSDGLEAWEVVSGEKPDLVLVGQGLSGISGLELCNRISSDSLTGGIPVVLMIGAKDDVTDEQIVSSGARGKLRKPFSPRDLLNVVERLAGSVDENGKAAANIDLAPRQQTKFITQVSSTHHLRQEKDSYNLEWLDLNDSETNKIIPKVASFDITGDDQGLVINEDQYGLSTPEFDPEPEPVSAPSPGPEKDEDYEWFLGEIKREMEGKAKADKQDQPQASISVNQSILTAKQPPEKIKYDDISSAEEPRRPTVNGNLPDKNGPVRSAVPSKSPDRGAVTPISTMFSDEQLSLLAERIAARLANQIAARIDKNQIMDAIKTVLKK